MVYGGLDCVTWKYASDKRTSGRAAADAIPLRLADEGELVTLADVMIEAADAEKDGGSSIAILAQAGANVDLSRCEILSLETEGRRRGAPVDLPATAGGDGMPGNDACSMDVGERSSAAAARRAHACDADSSVSGAGGIGQEPAGKPGAGSPGCRMTPARTVLAVAPVKVRPTHGTPRHDRRRGSGRRPWRRARPATARSASGYTGIDGGKDNRDRGQGRSSGGGAEAARRHAPANNNAWPARGPQAAVARAAGPEGAVAHGGKGGGAGGCQHRTGVARRDAHVRDVKLTAPTGGKGGDGGLGQAGGSGGKGAAGGKTPAMATDLKAGCAGGDGGKGGAGGQGGGGRGGPSIGIAHTGTEPAITGAPIVPGTPGDGGTGDGSAGAGAKGTAGPSHEF